MIAKPKASDPLRAVLLADGNRGRTLLEIVEALRGRGALHDPKAIEDVRTHLGLLVSDGQVRHAAGIDRYFWHQTTETPPDLLLPVNQESTQARIQGLKHECKLLALLGTRDMTWAELRTESGLNDKQVQDALRGLRRDQKIVIVQERHSHEGGNIYGFNDDWNPTMVSDYHKDRWHGKPEPERCRDNTRRLSGRKKETLQFFLTNMTATLPEYIRFRDRKIRALRKCLDLTEGEDMEALYLIIQDYERGARKGAA